MQDIDRPLKLSGRSDATNEWRYAGQQLGINLNSYEGIPDAGVADLRRVRSDKFIPDNFNSMMKVRPELSEPGYTESGSYQPEVAYGA